MRSRSSVRDAFGAPRLRPNARSMAKSASRTSFGGPFGSTRAMALRYSGPAGSGQAADRHQLDRAITGNPAWGNHARAAANSASLDAKSPARLEARATTTASSRLRFG